MQQSPELKKKKKKGHVQACLKRKEKVMQKRRTFTSGALGSVCR